MSGPVGRPPLTQPARLTFRPHPIAEPHCGGMSHARRGTLGSEIVLANHGPCPALSTQPDPSPR